MAVQSQSSPPSFQPFATEFFGVNIAGVEANIQFGRYDSSDRGFYDWHTGFAGLRLDRKISISIQLSKSAD